MNGLERNISKLFSNQEKLFLIALDHPQYSLIEGLEDPIRIIEFLAKSFADGFILNPGIFKILPNSLVKDKKLVMRGTISGSKFSKASSLHSIVVSPETILSYGADAVILMMVIGRKDFISLKEISVAIENFHRYSIPVIVEIIAEEFEKTIDPDLVATGARIAAEMGADAVKVYFTEDFQRVISSCPIPVLLAGGPKTDSILRIARIAVENGVKGFAFGRNVFQSNNPIELIKELNYILRGGYNLKEN